MVVNTGQPCSFPKFAHITPDTCQVKWSSTANWFYVLSPSALGDPANGISQKFWVEKLSRFYRSLSAPANTMALELEASICTEPIPSWSRSAQQQMRGLLTELFRQTAACRSSRQQEAIMSGPLSPLPVTSSLLHNCISQLKTRPIWIPISSVPFRTWGREQKEDQISATRFCGSFLPN